MSCPCKICRRNRVYDKHISLIKGAGLEDETIDFIKGQYSDLNHVEMDRDYYKAILYGTWPNADEIIHRLRNPATQVLKELRENKSNG